MAGHEILMNSTPKIAHLSYLVGLRGLEPPTLRLSGVRSNHLSYKPIVIKDVGLFVLFLRPMRSRCACSLVGLSHSAPQQTVKMLDIFSVSCCAPCLSSSAHDGSTLLAGGDEEDRTPDPLLARQVLSQLSYTPI